MGALSVRVLGEFSIDGVDVQTLADRKARLMLRWLAVVRGRPVPADAVADALWGDTPPARPTDQVAVLASRLRRALGRDAIEHGDDGYRLRYDWLDADELDAVLEEAERRRAGGNVSGAVAAGRVALSLVRGRLPTPGTQAEWVTSAYAALDRLVRRTRHVAATAMLEAGDWPDALELATADAGENPYDEEAVRLTMLANAAGGRPALALAAYADLRRVLADELGADPAETTTDLHTAILRGEAVVPEPRPSAAAVTLVGRSSQLQHLDSLALRRSEGELRVAVVTGEAGIGKSTLVQAWSEGRAAAGDTVLFGRCGPLERSAPLDAVLVAIGEHLRRSDDPAGLLGDEAAVLAPLLGVSTVATLPRDLPVDPALGPAALYAAITAVLGRVAGEQGAILIIDDAHLAGPVLTDWLAFAARRRLPVLVVVTVRSGEGEPFPAADMVMVGPLDRAAAEELVGAERAGDLYERSRGHPLFLLELAQSPADALPPSILAAVDQICGQLGAAADVVRTAAVLGPVLDIDLLSSVTRRPSLEVLADVELAETRELLVEQSGRHSFRHDLVREALAASTRSARVALLHREAAAALDRRPDADPVAVAEHASLGGDLPLAARALRDAALRAAERFDHATAEDLLDQSLRLREDDRTRLARARVLIRRERYADADAEVAATTTAGVEGSEVRAWAAYFDRRFDDAVRHARDGEIAAQDDLQRARCLTVGGRTLHARGDLDDGERLLSEALGSAVGDDRVTAAAWLGVLRAHRSQTGEAIDLLRPALQPGIGVDHTSATLHALLFTGHAHALAGRPAEALEAFGRYTAEVERRQVPRFAGRGVNFAGWVLRNVGATGAGLDHHQEALSCVEGEGTPEVRIAALEDLAEQHLVVGDVDAAAALLDQAETSLVGPLVFGWRLALKLGMLRSRLALARDHPEDALRHATELVEAAERIGVPRYASVARLLTHQARTALGEPVDLDLAWRDLTAVEGAVALEAWWWAAETGSALGSDRWLVRAEELAAQMAKAAGGHAESLRAEADRRLELCRVRMR